MKDITTTRELKSSLKYWLKEFGLYGWWEASIEFVDPMVFENQYDAETAWDIETRRANVRVVRPRKNTLSVRQRVIHEVIHLRIPLEVQEEMARKMFEAGIDATADVIDRQFQLIHHLAAEVTKLRAQLERPTKD